MESERRGARRYPFFASAELTELTSGARSKASASDLGSNGCFLDTLDPLPSGTVINIQITYQGQVFAAGGGGGPFAPQHGDGREIHCPRVGLRLSA
jgi:hypothetical protein